MISHSRPTVQPASSSSRLGRQLYALAASKYSVVVCSWCQARLHTALMIAAWDAGGACSSQQSPSKPVNMESIASRAVRTLLCWSTPSARSTRW